MMSRHWVVFACMTALLGLWCASPALAQTPGAIYTWDWAIGEGAGGPNVESWSGAANATLDNNSDGVLTITETDALGFNIGESWNRIRESASGMDAGGLDLVGLESIEFVVGHSGTQTLGGKIYVQAPSGWHDVTISVAPGAPQTFSFPLSGLTADDIPWINSMGLQVWDHSWADEGAALTWTIDEVRSAGTALVERYLSPHEVGDLDGAVVNWDSAAITGGADGTQNGLSTVVSDTGSGALRWIDLAGQNGAAIAWGNGRDGNLAKIWPTFPMDLSNYQFVDVRMRAADLPTSGVDESIDLQFYAQTTGGWTFQSAGTRSLPVDGEYHVVTFPVGNLTGMDLVMTHGIDLMSHTANTDIRVDYILFRHVPEPSSALLLVIGCLSLLGLARKQG
jgi:hypothetical protein